MQVKKSFVRHGRWQPFKNWMEKQSPLDDRDRAIAARLLRFREETKIPRTVFALSLGIGGERLASYEKARVRLKYLPVRRMIQEFKLNPAWLATGNGPAFLTYSFDDSDFADSIPRKALFTWVFDRFLSDRLAEASSEQAKQFQHLVNSAWELAARFENDPLFAKAFSTHDLHRHLDGEERLIRALRKILSSRGADLTPFSHLSIAKTVQRDIPRNWEELRMRLKRATDAPNEKSELARTLNVTPAAVSQWLSGDSQPTAEMTIQLLNRVQRLENKKNLRSAINTPKGRGARSNKSSSNERRSGPNSKSP